MAKRILTVPNQLTFLRLGFLPFFIILVLYRRYPWALAILLLAALTDAMDGMLARTLQQKTALGAYLDPIADKLLLSSSFVALALDGQIRWWLTLLVFVVLMLAVFHGDASADGHGLAVARQLLGYLVAGFTVFSGFHYSVVVARRLSQPQEARD